MKKILFWISFVPIGLIIFFLSGIEEIFSVINDKVYDWTSIYEEWCFK